MKRYARDNVTLLLKIIDGTVVQMNSKLVIYIYINYNILYIFIYFLNKLHILYMYIFK